ncbi:MAG: radical SAM family heme chaperone HemW [Alphaproteobacteria bacterium]|nr:radical SAM family heme chaperone HemW [Alphaproteobacteria bacterium]
MRRLGIYIHWPYCKSKCPYCGFFSRVQTLADEDEIIASYLEDLRFYRAFNDEYKVASIFFGGGTPSLMAPRNIARLIDEIMSLWKTDDNLEISLEANPNTNHQNLFSDLQKAGVNRLSLGVQALDDEGLKILGRTHNYRQALDSIAEIKEIFLNHSMDLIYARPHQSLSSWQKELEKACGFGLKHLSLYQLTIEENTEFFRRGIKSIDDELSLEFYRIAREITAQYGYNCYEVSNYALQGFECRHNLGYWQGCDYVGVGEGAVGRIRNKEQFFHLEHRRHLVPLSTKERAEELLIMGLRLKTGLNKKLFFQQCGINLSEIIDHNKTAILEEEGFLYNFQDKLCLSDKGYNLIDYIVAQIIK